MLIASTKQAPAGGLDLYGKHYAGGEYVPFFVPRLLMPQVEGKFYDEFTTFAGDLLTQHRDIDPHSLVPHQRVQVDHAVNLTPELAEKPVIVSNDNYILDGHHRWYWHIIKPELMNVLKLDLPFTEAVNFLFKFPHTYCYKDNQGDER